MPAIFGIFDRDGPPVDGRSALGPQACTLDNIVRIAADARLDARGELIAKLNADAQSTDSELILRAYQAWGEACLDHLLGDFAFILWDGRRSLWFCARDHFGVKPLYYAETGRTLVCGNSLDHLRRHPGISATLNDQAVADFLLFEMNQDAASTYFADIRRLPAGHCLVCSHESLQVRRYWSLPRQEVRYRRATDYMERFHELFHTAVKERTREDKVAVFMSGGADSTLVAAVARRVMNPSVELRAFTTVFDRIIPDQERRYSGIAADFLGIPIEYLAADDYVPYNQLPQSAAPEPYPLAAMRNEQYRRAADYAGVVLTGLGGDPTLQTNDTYIADYLTLRSMGQLLSGIAWCVRLSGHAPRLGFRRLLREKLGKTAGRSEPPYPPWLNHDLEKRLGLAERWRQIVNTPPASGHWRAAAERSLRAPLWQTSFETFHPGYTGIALEQRHPFFDVRVVTFLAGLPPLPWCQEKNILKAAGRGILPDAVRLRPKAPLGGDPVWEHLRGQSTGWWDEHMQPAPELARYADPGRLRRTAENPRQLWVDLRVVSLNYWLRSSR